jgi:uncharacterized delta-60 repeat protein
MRVRKVALFLPAISVLIVAAGSSAGKPKPASYLDRGFGHRGIVRSTFGGFPALDALAVQPDGKILVAGSWAASQSDLATSLLVARFLPKGALDPSFGRRGWVTTATGTRQSASVSALALERDGKIIAVGASGPDSGPGAHRAEIVRYDSNGSLDRSFGSAGVVETVGTSLGATAVALQRNGKILVGGAGTKRMVLVRYLQDGSRDRSFGNEGVATRRTPRLVSETTGIAVEPDGDIILSGNGVRYDIYGDTARDIILVRYHPDGSLDRHFGKRGVTTTTSALGTGVALTRAGKIVVGGTAHGTVGMSVQDFAVERYTAKGHLDRSFGAAGRASLHVSSFPNDFGGAFALQRDGKVVVGGYTAVPHRPATQIRLVRFRSNGRVDRGFGRNGVIRTRVGRTAGLDAVRMQRNGKIVAAGGSWGERGFSAVLLRYLRQRK